MCHRGGVASPTFDVVDRTDGSVLGSFPVSGE
ncbi:MAG: hypothetical protein JWN84_1150, partial [Nocardioides sp.]|nr:hypothetical protein [Nocardioides sp.]